MESGNRHLPQWLEKKAQFTSVLSSQPGLLRRVVAMTLHLLGWRRTFQAVPMLRAQGDCDIKGRVSCSLSSEEIKVNLNSLSTFA